MCIIQNITIYQLFLMNFDYSLCKPNIINDTKCAAFQNAPSSNSSNKKHPLLKSSSIELEQSRQVCGSSKRYLQSLGIWHLDLARAWAEASFKCSFLTTKHSWANRQKPVKNWIQKIREIDGSYLCLQQFDKFWLWSASNDDRKLKLFESWKKIVKSH